MIEILVLYHSQSGNTETMARAVAQGVELIQGCRARLLPASEAGFSELTACDGLAIGSPAYFGYMAGLVKDFFDRTYEQAKGHKKVFRKPTVLLVSCGNDGSGAVSSMERILLGFQVRMVQEPLVISGAPGEADLARCRELGQTLAAGIEAGIF